ncbi:MAG: response regulator [Campylobacterales bacterium]|nr:response regulator [Campylobacterales bacterium]
MVNIVYIDDEVYKMRGGDKEEVKDLLESDLEDITEKFELYIYDNGEDAIERILSLGNNTIIILDMQMPEINGAEVLEKIRKNNNTCPVIGYSANKSNGKNDHMLVSLLENDLFDYVERAEADRSNLIQAINKAIEKFKDNIPLELNEALNEYLERNEKFKDVKIIVKEDGENKEVAFSNIQEHINKGTTFGRDYQKAIYKIAFEDFKEQRKVIE